MIKILGLGPGDEEYLTLGAVKEIEKSKRIFLRTKNHPAVEFLKRSNIEFSSYDSFYEEKENFMFFSDSLSGASDDFCF